MHSPVRPQEIRALLLKYCPSYVLVAFPAPLPYSLPLQGLQMGYVHGVRTMTLPSPNNPIARFCGATTHSQQTVSPSVHDRRYKFSITVCGSPSQHPISQESVVPERDWVLLHHRRENPRERILSIIQYSVAMLDHGGRTDDVRVGERFASAFSAHA